VGALSVTCKDIQNKLARTGGLRGLLDAGVFAMVDRVAGFSTIQSRVAPGVFDADGGSGATVAGQTFSCRM
jgi:hypothetical protein